MSDSSRIRRDGWRAYSEGAPADRNPWLTSTVWGAEIKAQDWLDGWTKAKTEDESSKQFAEDEYEQWKCNNAEFLERYLEEKGQ